MISIVFGVGLVVIALLASVSRLESPWPREGHGHSYFDQSTKRR